MRLSYDFELRQSLHRVILLKKLLQIAYVKVSLNAVSRQRQQVVKAILMEIDAISQANFWRFHI